MNENKTEYDRNEVYFCNQDVGVKYCVIGVWRFSILPQ